MQSLQTPFCAILRTILFRAKKADRMLTAICNCFALLATELNPRAQWNKPAKRLRELGYAA